MTGSEPRIAGRVGRLAGGAAALIVCAATALALASASPAHDLDPPTISGDPIVGDTLTSSEVGDPGFYKWQRCDPAPVSQPTVANGRTSEPSPCGDATGGSPDWTDIPGASGEGARTYTVVPADIGYLIRVLAKERESSSHLVASAPVGPVTAPITVIASPEPPAEAAPVPQHGVQLTATPLKGIVKVKPPGQAGFSVLTGASAIPVNSVIDTRGSEVQLTAATGPFGSETKDDSVFFRGGLFRILQPAATDSAAVAKLVEKLACRSGSASATASAAGPEAVTAGKRKRKLWGRGSGNYQTAGGGGTGSVRGTTWLTKDTCKGTRFYVSEGVGITVFDFDLDKLIDLGPGESYFASR